MASDDVPLHVIVCKRREGFMLVRSIVVPLGVRKQACFNAQYRLVRSFWTPPGWEQLNPADDRAGVPEITHSTTRSLLPAEPLSVALHQSSNDS